MNNARVALYFTPPPDHPLVVAAAAWLGRDAFGRRALPRGSVDGLGDGEVDDLTAAPRRYGFHATLKPPFRFAAGESPDSLHRALTAFAVPRPAITIPALALSRIGPFFALTPADDSAEVDALAADVVRVFEPFRAAMTSEEIARRRPERLSARQRTYLETWGYPYVFDEFRFHMTLTGPVPVEHRDLLHAALGQRFAAFLGQPLAIDALALFVEPHPPGDFVVDARYALTPGAAG
ncbi:DUF1045 domain-containing protein [Bauldia sp.]|uniref:DUF1045 domain-containing protein n=1 Tax=Bauldia sp. TaxID=2575872 RepID=UPI003BAB4A06